MPACDEIASLALIQEVACYSKVLERVRADSFFFQMRNSCDSVLNGLDRLRYNQ